MKKSISVHGVDIVLFEQKDIDYISLTDIARYKNNDDPRFVIQNRMKSRNTIEYLWFWELLKNPDFNRVDFDTFRTEAGWNGFVMTPSKWTESTNAIGMMSKSWRYGWGTFAHKDIAFKFASWISPEFELYIIQEFQRLKKEEYKKKSLWWDVQRMMASMNYKLQTDAIQKHIIPTLSEFKKKFAYADEADLLNVIVFGKTAKTRREKNPNLSTSDNIRDHATIIDITLITNLETHNAELIKAGKLFDERYEILADIANSQREILTSQYIQNIKKLPTIDM